MSVLFLYLAALLTGCTRSVDSSPSYGVRSAANRERAAVVFIHGVMGDARATWASPSDPDGWPGLVARDPKLALDTYSIGYRTTKITAASNIEEISVRLLQRIHDQGLFANYEKLVFVAHSMGGLVLKRTLSRMYAERSPELAKVRGAIMLATPAHGSDLAALTAWISSNPQFNDMSPSDFNSYLQALDNDFETLLRARTESSPFPKVYCAYETLSTGPVKVVPRSSSQLACDATSVAFDRNHAGIAKPASMDDELHVYLRARILDSLSSRAIAQKVTVHVQRPDGTLLQAAEHLRSGDRYFIRVKAARPGWFYVFNQDSSDKFTRYFPSREGGEQSGPVTSLRVPASQDRLIALDDVRGTERLYVFVSDQPEPKLAAFASEVMQSRRQDRRAAVERELKLRGGFVTSTVERPLRPDEAMSPPASYAAVATIDHR
nr:alpha/beta fold hydrolase [Telluria cellulosilytica]